MAQDAVIVPPLEDARDQKEGRRWSSETRARVGGRVILLCLVVSGYCGLAYEVLWTRLMTLTFGSTTLSFAAVVAAFFGGLAAGSWLGGREAASLARPIRAYALIEMAAGGLGLALYPIMTRLDAFFVHVDPGPTATGALVRLGVSTALLIAPTLLMGATLPIVCAGVLRRDEDAGRGLALSYGFNTLGAFLGVYLVTYFLLPGVGVFLSNAITAALNLIAGGVALAVDRSLIPGHSTASASASPGSAPASTTVGAEPGAQRHGRDRNMVLVATGITFLNGFAFIAYEVVWARLFSNLLQGTVYGVGAVLICFLLGIAIGSLLIARTLQGSRHLALWYAALQATTVAAVLLLSRGLPRLAHVLSNLTAERTGTLVPQHLQLLVVFLALLLPTATSGASLPLLVRLVEATARGTGRALGGLYAANTFGSILGSVATGFVLIPLVGSPGAMSVATALVALAGALGGALLTQGRKRIIGGALAAAAVALLSLDRGFDARLMAVGPSARALYEQFVQRYEQKRAHLVYFAEGRNATIAVEEGAENRGLQINGLGQGGRTYWPPHHVLESLLVGLVPLVHVEEPRSALIVGLGAGITVDLLRELGVPRIKVVELEPRVADAVKLIFRGQSPLDEPGVELVIDDARHHLLIGAARRSESYDIITSMPFHPWAAPNLFTQEFFEIARSNLGPNGVFATWFGVGKMDQPAVQSVLRAFAASFPNYVAYYVPETGAYYLVGAERPLSLGMERLRALCERHPLSEEPLLRNPYFLPVRVYATGEGGNGKPAPGVVNDDDSAYVELHAPRSGPTSPVVTGFLPHEYVLPALVPEQGRREMYLGLLESLLGTPDAKFPLRTQPVFAERARLTLDAVRSVLTEQEAVYFEGRLALAENKQEAAREHFKRASAGGGPIAGLAQKFRSSTFPAGPARLEALLSVPPSSDVLMNALEIDEARALARVQRMRVDAAADPAGWVLQKAAQAAEPRPDDRAIFIQHVGKQLLGSDHPELLRVTERFARRLGLEAEAEILAARRRSLTEIRARQTYVSQGIAAGNEHRFTEAVDALWRANSLDPGNEPTMRALLRALTEIGDHARIAELSDQFRFLGRSESHIQALLQDAKERTLVFGKTPTAAAGAMSGEGPPKTPSPAPQE